MKNNLLIFIAALAISNFGFSIHNATQNSEYMDPMKMRINDKLGLFTSVAKFEKFFGKPDSIIKIADWDGICQSGIRDENSTFRYYAYSCFESFSDSVSMNSLDIRKGSKFFIQYGKLRLDSNTTLQQLKKIYPKSFSDVEIATTNGFQGEVELVSISQDPDPNVDSMWVFIFQHGKLVRIDDWLPC